MLTFILGLGLVCVAGGVAASAFRARNDAELLRENEYLRETLDRIAALTLEQHAVDPTSFVRQVLADIAATNEVVR